MSAKLGDTFGAIPFSATGVGSSILRRLEALEAVNRGRVQAAAALNPQVGRTPLDWYLSQLGDA